MSAYASAMRGTIFAFLTALFVCAAPLGARAADHGGVTLDCKQTTAATVRRVMGYRTRRAANASVLVAMHDETHIRIATNLLYGGGARPVSAVLDNSDARSIAGALYDVFSFAYQKDEPDITDEEIRAGVARKTIYIERRDFHAALEFFSFADLSNVRIYDAPRR